MSKFIILVETGADVPADMAERYGIVKVPMHVSFGNETKDDGAFPTEELFSYYKATGKLPQTSGCTPHDFEMVFDELHEKYPDRHLLHLAYSAATTCSLQSAVLAAKGRDYVTSIDTKHVSAGQALVTLCTARYLERHPDCSVEEVTAEVLRLREICRMGFLPGDLVYLKAGGRVSNAAYLGAKLLNLSPLIEIRDGKLDATKKYRGDMKKIAMRLLEEFTDEQKLTKELMAFVYSPGLPEELKKRLEARAKELGFREILWIETGCVVSTHSGPGAFGVSGFSGL